MKKYRQINESSIDRLQEEILNIEDEKERMSDPMYDVEKSNNQTFDYPESGELLQPVETATDDYIKVLCNSIINNMNCLCEICANSDECSVDKDDLISMLIDLNRNLEWALNCNGEQPVDNVEYLDEPAETIIV